MKRKIDFTIIGAQKAGTTSLYAYVGKHPDVFVPAMKEIGYFANDRFYEKGEDYLATFYQDAGDAALLGHAYVTIMMVPAAARRLYDHNPDMRLVAMLRNPIDRAYSAYWHARRDGTEELSFEDALERERVGGNRTFVERVTRSYVEAGEYMRRLEPFVERFGRDRLLVLFFDDLQAHRAETVARAFRHIGANSTVSVDVSGRENPAQLPRFATVQRLITGDSALKRAYAAVMPPRWREAVRRTVVKPVEKANLRRFSYPEMAPSTRDRLREHFAEHNQRLSEWLGRDLTHWN